MQVLMFNLKKESIPAEKSSLAALKLKEIIAHQYLTINHFGSTDVFVRVGEIY